MKKIAYLLLILFALSLQNSQAWVRHRVVGGAPAAGGGAPANYPTRESVTETTSTADANTYNCDMPGTTVSGELLLAFIATGASDGHLDNISGWTQEVTGQTTGAATLSIYSKTATGSDGATITVQISAADNGNSASCQIWRISNWTTLAISTAATGTSVNPNSPSLTSGFGTVKTMWIAVAAADNDGNTATAWPYDSGTEVSTSIETIADGTANNSVELWGDYTTTEAASEDPGAMTINGSENWAAYTVAVEGQ